MQGRVEQAVTTTLKLSPPVTAISLSWAGLALSDWVLLFTLFYTGLLIVEQVLKLISRFYGGSQ